MATACYRSTGPYLKKYLRCLLLSNCLYKYVLPKYLSNSYQSISKSLSQTCTTENIEMFENVLVTKYLLFFYVLKKHHDMY